MEFCLLSVFEDTSQYDCSESTTPGTWNATVSIIERYKV